MSRSGLLSLGFLHLTRSFRGKGGFMNCASGPQLLLIYFPKGSTSISLLCRQNLLALPVTKADSSSVLCLTGRGPPPWFSRDPC